MKFNPIFKIFTLVLLFILGIMVPAFADEIEPNILSRIIVEEPVDNNFNVNLIFEEKFNGNAFLQKRYNGSYDIFIPEAYANRHGVKVIYKDINNKPNIKFNIAESSYIKSNAESSYVKIAVDIIGPYTIQLYSKTIDEIQGEPYSPQFTKYNVMAFLVLLLVIFLLYKAISGARSNGYRFSNMEFGRTYIPRSRKIESTDEMEEEEYVPSYLSNNNSMKRNTSNDMTMPMVKDLPLPDERVLPKVNIKKSMKPTEGESFSCFDLPFAGELDNAISSEEMQNTIRQASLAQKEKAAKSKTTNPIAKAKEEASELELPIAEPAKVVDKNQPELLSELRITPRKGFYLTTIGSTFALFGFVDSNVYLLKKFSDLSQINLQARFYDRQKSGDLYIVKLDSYKAMVEISDTGIKELSVL